MKNLQETFYNNSLNIWITENINALLHNMKSFWFEIIYDYHKIEELYKERENKLWNYLMSSFESIVAFESVFIWKKRLYWFIWQEWDFNLLSIWYSNWQIKCDQPWKYYMEYFVVDNSSGFFR